MTAETLQPITDVGAVLYKLLLGQYQEPRTDGAPPVLAGIISLLGQEGQYLETAWQELLPLLDVDQIGGVLLDTIGRIANTPRAGLSDPDYRLALKAAFLRHDSGTPEQVMRVVKQVTQSTLVQYIPEYPAGYWIICDGHGLTRDLLERISPAGVLAMPFCYLEDAYGNLIRTATNDPILVVGPCESQIFPTDNVWDAGVGAVNPDDLKLTQAWPFRDGTGIGELPDGGIGPINPLAFTFTDGTFAENP